MKEYLKKYWLLILPAISGIGSILSLFGGVGNGNVPAVQWVLGIVQAALPIGGICLVLLSEKKQANDLYSKGYVMLAVWLVLCLVGVVGQLILCIRYGFFNFSMVLSWPVIASLAAFLITRRKTLTAANKDVSTAEKTSTGTSYLDAYKKSRKQ